MNRSGISAAGSLVTAVAASLCCIGPVAVVLLGVGGIGAFSAFEEYRVPLIVATILLLGVAFWLTYRKREILCEDGICRVQQAGKWNRISIWSATLFAGVAIAFPYLGIPAVPSSGPQLPVIATDSAAVTLHVDDMTCEACARGIEASLAQTRGILNVKVDYELGRAVVRYAPSMTSPDAIAAAIDAMGYQARSETKAAP